MKRKQIVAYVCRGFLMERKFGECTLVSVVHQIPPQKMHLLLTYRRCFLCLRVTKVTRRKSTSRRCRCCLRHLWPDPLHLIRTMTTDQLLQDNRSQLLLVQRFSTLSFKDFYSGILQVSAFSESFSNIDVFLRNLLQLLHITSRKSLTGWQVKL